MSTKIEECKVAINEVADFLRKHPGSPKIIIKMSRNLGDTLHMLPVFRHYKLKYPKCVIGFLTQKMYAGVHTLNKDIDKLGLFPNDLSSQDRLPLWDIIKNLPGIDLKIIPAINPFQAVHKCNAWSHAVMTDQVMQNAGIEDCKPLGGRRYVIPISDEDKQWAKDWFSAQNLDPRSCGLFEYISYSHPVAWRKDQWVQLINKCKARGANLIGVAGTNEGMIPGMIDGRGISWARTVAIANMVPKMIGVGSGITMLAAGAETQPIIIELGLPPSVSISVAGYAPSFNIPSPTVNDVENILNTPNAKLFDRLKKI